jgi:ankyrin repeat protein
MVEATQFADAVWAGDLPAVEAMIAAGADVNAPGAEDLPTPLHLAIEQQWIEIVQRLIAAGADVNRDTPVCFGTPLAHAIDIESDAASQRYGEPGHESTELTALLLAAGAVPTEKAFETARAYGNQRALALLERYARRG